MYHYLLPPNPSLDHALNDAPPTATPDSSRNSAPPPLPSSPALDHAPSPSRSSDLSIMYNDRAVLENYHVSSVFKLFKDDDLNILSGLKKEEYR